MRETPYWRRYLRMLGSNPAADVEDEIEFHFTMRVEDLMRNGLSAAEARARSEIEFGDLGKIQTEMREIGRRRQRRERRVRGWDSLRQDVRYGVRLALRSPLFSLLAIVTLALGIGANAAVFSVVKSVLLDSLPYRDAGRLVRVYSALEDGALRRAPISPAMIMDIRERHRSFERPRSEEHTPELQPP